MSQFVNMLIDSLGLYEIIGDFFPEAKWQCCIFRMNTGADCGQIMVSNASWKRFVVDPGLSAAFRMDTRLWCWSGPDSGIFPRQKWETRQYMSTCKLYEASEMRCIKTSRSFVFSVVVLPFSGAIVHRITPSACGYSRAGAWVIPDPYIFC